MIDFIQKHVPDGPVKGYLLFRGRELGAQLPKNPMDELIQGLGGREKVAEVSTTLRLL
jgi:hypothetical protein